MGLHPFLSREQIRRIEIEAGEGAPGEAANATPEVATATQEAEIHGDTNKKRCRELTSEVWKHFKRGPVKEDGSYKAICNYCNDDYDMGNQRSTSSMKHHINKGCKKIPAAIRRKPDALQKFLQTAKATGMFLLHFIVICWNFYLCLDCC